jgi:hypothetical protein
MNPTNGKGSGRLHDRTKLSDEEMQVKWDRIFGKKDKPKDEVKKDKPVL